MPSLKSYLRKAISAGVGSLRAGNTANKVVFEPQIGVPTDFTAPSNGYFVCYLSGYYDFFEYSTGKTGIRSAGTSTSFAVHAGFIPVRQGQIVRFVIWNGDNPEIYFIPDYTN